ncbi:nitroreductase family protein [Desulfobotulus sp. H1]|uniref:Nitroreductase family protein n=1 Tax=Desulfobotulus pelophilus TaxID=2823377 RepID=A0ABT3N5R3_9BACT|nr:nitroreductase family protein [Desulfobotulus pelophilus]MCW7752798.1 nitroreductase family protein [Desulfobotulus pelophilus]
MSELLNVLKSRRSIRKFEDRMVSGEDLQKILEAVQWSQSWANTQCWEVIVVRDEDTRLGLQETLAPRNPATKAIVAAPLLLVLCGKKGASGYYDGKAPTVLGDWMLYDLGIATQSLCLTAHDMGLATVVVGLFDHAKAADILGVPDAVQVVSMIPLGYPEKAPKAPERKALDVFCHNERYGG